jgi:hypothetical protein
MRKSDTKYLFSVENNFFFHDPAWRLEDFPVQVALPGQTLAPVFVTASPKIRIIFYIFFGPSASSSLRHLKNVETGAQRMDFFSKCGVTFLSLRFAPLLPFLTVSCSCCGPAATDFKYEGQTIIVFSKRRQNRLLVAPAVVLL